MHTIFNTEKYDLAWAEALQKCLCSFQKHILPPGGPAPALQEHHLTAGVPAETPAVLCLDTCSYCILCSADTVWQSTLAFGVCFLRLGGAVITALRLQCDCHKPEASPGCIARP